MRKNYYLADVVTKAKVIGYSDAEIQYAVKEGLKAYDKIKEQMEKTEQKKKA